MVGAETLSRWRVPLGWGLGLSALFLAAPRLELYVAGLALAAFGEGIRIWAAGHLDKNTRLTTAGPYAWCRNPLYFGSAWVGLGFMIATGRVVLVALVVVLFAAVYVPVMKREAARLTKAFPETYPGYAERTPLFWPRPPNPGVAGAGAFSMARTVRNREHWTVVGWVAAAGVIGWKLL